MLTRWTLTMSVFVCRYVCAYGYWVKNGECCKPIVYSFNLLVRVSCEDAVSHLWWTLTSYICWISKKWAINSEYLFEIWHDFTIFMNTPVFKDGCIFILDISVCIWTNKAGTYFKFCIYVYIYVKSKDLHWRHNIHGYFIFISWIMRERNWIKQI